MKGFRFRLQPVLDLRELEEDEAARVLGDARRVEASEREQLSCLTGLRDSVEAELDAGGAVALDPRHVMSCLGYLSRLQGRIAVQTEEVQKAARESEERREELVLASMERRKLERLKERRHEEHLEQVRVAEERELDDVRTSRFGRSRTC